MIKLSFALLSGGNSVRFGSDKTTALYKGIPLFMYGLKTGLTVSDDVLHISKNPDKYKPFIDGVKYLTDDLETVCPMSGLIKAGNDAVYNNIFVISADAPLVNSKFIQFLADYLNSYDGVVPSINNKLYPLISIYKKHVLKSMIDDYNNNNFKIIKSLERFNILYLNENIIFNNGFNTEIFTNINYTDDLKKLEVEK